MQRKVLFPLVAAQVVGILGLGGYLVAKAAGGSGEAGDEQGSELSTVVVATSASSVSLEITPTSTVIIATTAPDQPQAPAVQGGQQPVQQQTQQTETTVTTEPPPGNTLTTTPPTTTSRVPDMPWCHHPEHGWFSGVGQGCHEGNPYFVEYR